MARGNQSYAHAVVGSSDPSPMEDSNNPFYLHNGVLFIHVFSINTKTHIQNIFNNQSLDRNQPESIFDAFDEEVSIF